MDYKSTDLAQTPTLGQISCRGQDIQVGHSDGSLIWLRGSHRESAFLSAIYRSCNTWTLMSFGYKRVCE